MKMLGLFEAVIGTLIAGLIPFGMFYLLLSNQVAFKP